MRCFACNADTTSAPGERVGFRDVCPRCGVDAHVCRNCTHHDRSAHNQCREAQAEWVSDRERANRCDWFAPGGAGGGALAREREQARGSLENLFKKKG